LQGLRWDLWPAHPWVRKPQPVLLGLLAKVGVVLCNPALPTLKFRYKPEPSTLQP
jgi:hypothetical protein